MTNEEKDLPIAYLVGSGELDPDGDVPQRGRRQRCTRRTGSNPDAHADFRKGGRCGDALESH